MVVKTINANVTHRSSITNKVISKTSNNLVIDDKNPAIYNLYIDNARGGVNLKTDSGFIIKPPVSLKTLLNEQYPTAVQANDDIYNVYVASNVALVGQTIPLKDMFPDEYNSLGINISTAMAVSWYNSTYTGGVNDIFALDLKHSSGDFKEIDTTYYVDFNKCYGTMLLFLWFLHSTNYSVRLTIYNANGTIYSDADVTPAVDSSKTVELNILKGQYAIVHLKYKPGAIDNKNDKFVYLEFFTISPTLHPTLLISSKYFNETHTVNIYNDGMILGHGGDSNNYTPEPGSSDFWNKEIKHIHVDTHKRIFNGGDAIMTTDIKALNIYNNGTIAGGGSGSYMKSNSGNILTYTPGAGGAPYGRGGATWTSYSATLGHREPIIYGNNGSLLTAGGASAGDLGEYGLGSNNKELPPGFYVRGTPAIIKTYGTGKYLGLHPNMTSLPVKS